MRTFKFTFVEIIQNKKIKESEFIFSRSLFFAFYASYHAFCLQSDKQNKEEEEEIESDKSLSLLFRLCLITFDISQRE